MTTPFPKPVIGTMVWCHFPELPNTEPRPKPRAALVSEISERTDRFVVKVVYGGKQNVDDPKAGNVVIRASHHKEAYDATDLSYDTRFDFNQMVELPWSDRYFKPPHLKPFGNSPKLGSLHASMYRAFDAAHKAATTPP